MKKDIEKRIPFISILLLGFIYVFLFYGEILLRPNDYIFSSTGDGIKNYYTYAYHIKNDSSYTNLEGMNYPYGENYLYTDCHPVLANAFKYLSSFSPYFETHSIGLLNLLLILSIALTFVVIYFVFIELKFNAWYSVIFSFCITLLAPQLFRLGGHLALSYSVAIPLSWLLILKCTRNPSWYLYVFLFLNNLFWVFIHAYLGIIIISFLFSFSLINYFFNDKKREKTIQLVYLGLVIVLPVILFYIYVALTDLHVGRTNNPSGFFLYNAELDDVLIPFAKPFRPFLDEITGGIISLKWEARGYLGIINSILFIAIIIISIISVFNKKARSLLKSFFNSKSINISLLSAFIILLFAMGVPFKQFPDLLDIFPIFKQFRATGRFVWPFYFVFTVFAAYVLHEKIICKPNIRNKIIAIVFVLFYAFIYSLEGYYYHSPVSKSISKTSNLFDIEQLPDNFKKALASVNAKDFQALISFPFYYYGSETYARPRQDEAVKNSLIFSYHTGIPNVCANLTRTSIEESKRIVQMVSPNYYVKEIVNDFKSNKPFLIIKTGTSLTKYEKAIMAKSERIYKNGNIELLKIEFEKLFSDDRNQKINEFYRIQPKLIKQDSFYVSKYSSVLYYSGFENVKSDTVYRGSGSFVSFKKGKNILVEFPPRTFKKKKKYDLSLWMFNGVPDALNLYFRVVIEEYDEQSNEWYTTTFFPESAEVIDNNWSLIEGTFKVHDPNNKIYIVTIGKDNSKATLHVDDILIKERGVIIYKVNEEDSTLFYNNHKIEMRL
jgi:hypothetical protein